MITAHFVLAGNSVFTVEPPVAWVQTMPGARPQYTYRVERKPASLDFPEAFFVMFLTGADPTQCAAYQYLGQLEPDTGEVNATRQSKRWEGTRALAVADRALRCVWKDGGKAMLAAGWDVHHECLCGGCGAPLAPEFEERGLHPACWAKLRAQFERFWEPAFPVTPGAIGVDERNTGD